MEIQLAKIGTLVEAGAYIVESFNVKARVPCATRVTERRGQSIVMRTYGSASQIVVAQSSWVPRFKPYQGLLNLPTYQTCCGYDRTVSAI